MNKSVVLLLFTFPFHLIDIFSSDIDDEAEQKWEMKMWRKCQSKFNFRATNIVLFMC